MPEPREPRSIIAAAEQAAVAGNYASAEELLREAILVQEASLGPLHPDLANTLNNLGVVCEITGNPVDAEHCFRRALNIAETVLEPDHPFVATSRKNLHDFCEARGTPVALLSSPAVATKPEAQATASEDLQSVVQRRSIRPHAIRFLGPGAMLIVIVAAASSWLGSTERTESSSAPITIDSRETPARRDVPLAVEPIAVPQETAKPAGSDLAGVSASVAAPTSARPVVVRAQLCAELYEWQCDPPDDPVPAGPLFFYTQVRSTRAMTIQHRWYRDNRLHRSVELRVQASPGAGYRTYSRNTMNSDSTGSWRVELRTQDGVVLHEERFSVR